MSFDNWSDRSWTIASHTRSPNFFAENCKLRFRRRNGRVLLESALPDANIQVHSCAYHAETDQLTLELEHPARRCVVSRFVHSTDPERQLLLARLEVKPGLDIGEAGSWTAVDGPGKDP